MNGEAQIQAPQTPALRMLLVLSGIAMLSGFLIVLAYQLSKPQIEENQRLAIEQAVFKVVAGASQRRDFLVSSAGLRPAGQGGEGITIYAAYDEQGQLKGIAARAAAQGYADFVHLLYAYDPDCACVRAFDVVKMAETPGLGDKILTDKGFLANFQALDARLNGAGDALAHAIVTVKHGAKRELWEIDAISGATVTSKAVGNAINQSAQRLLPLLVPRIDEIRQLPAEKPAP